MPRIRLLTYALTMCLLIPHALAAEKEDFLNSVVNKLSGLEGEYRNGFCERLENDELYTANHKRILHLLALDDTLSYPSGMKSITGRWIGNLNVFMVGRQLNNNFVNFIQYAERPDVADIIAKDMSDMEGSFAGGPITALFEEIKKGKNHKEFSKRFKEIKQQGLQPMPKLTQNEVNEKASDLIYGPLPCYIYQIVMDERSAAAIQFQNYANSVSKRAMHKNMRKFEDAVSDLQ